MSIFIAAKAGEKMGNFVKNKTEKMFLCTRQKETGFIALLSPIFTT